MFGTSRSSSCVVYSEYLASTQEWALSCTNLTDSFWSTELPFDAVAALRDASGATSWGDFFWLVRSAMLSNSIFINLTATRSNIELRMTTEEPSAASSPSPSSASASPLSSAEPTFRSLPKITLQRLSAGKSEALSRAILALAEDSQRASSLARELATLQQTLATTQAELARLRAQPSHHHSPHSNSHEAAFSSSPSHEDQEPRSPHAPLRALRKRVARPKHSLINPTQKRPRATGLQLVEDSDSDE